MSVQTKVSDIGKRLESLNSASNNKQAEILDLLKTLQDQDMNLDILSSTRIGMTVNKIRKASDDKEVISTAKNLIRKWKKFLPETDSGNGNDKESPNHQSKTQDSNKRGTDSDSDGASSKKIKLDSRKEKDSNKAATPSAPAAPKGGQTSFPASCTTDSVRIKCRELLCNSIRGEGELPDGSNDPENLAQRLEEDIFNEFKNTEMKYKNRVRSRIANLKDSKNPDLRLNFLTGSISSARMAKMSAEEMASAEMKKIREQFVKEGINDSQLAMVQGTKTDLLKCNKCGKRNCTYNQLQTRSADEPMTTFVLCNVCGNRWKFC